MNSMIAICDAQIAPEIVQAIIAKATANGLSVNDYLRRELGLTNDARPSERPFYVTATPEEWVIELLNGLIVMTRTRLRSRLKP